MESFTKQEPVQEDMETLQEATVSEEQFENIMKEEVAVELIEEQNNSNALQTETMENVMNQGIQFLASLFKMSTGKDMGLENQKIEIDKKTGEVVMRFKIPKLQG